MSGADTAGDPAAGRAERPAHDGIRRGATAIGPFAQRWDEVGEGPPVLLLHGVYAGAHGVEWRAVADRLADRARVRTPDLLGFGRSDRPDLEHTPDVLLSSVQHLIADTARAAGTPPLVAASSLTAAYVVRAVADGAAAAGVVLVTPTGLGAPQSARRSRLGSAGYALGRHTPLGDLATLALGSRPSVRWFLEHKAFGDPSAVTDELVDAYSRAARQPASKHATLAFVADRLALPLQPAEIRRVAPVVIWAGAESWSSTADAERWRAAGAAVEVWEGVGVPPAERPAEVADRIGGLLDDRAAGR